MRGKQEREIGSAEERLGESEESHVISWRRDDVRREGRQTGGDRLERLVVRGEQEVNR